LKNNAEYLNVQFFDELGKIEDFNAKF
jgi:hypothetical protein